MHLAAQGGQSSKKKAEHALAAGDDRRFNELSAHARSPGYELSVPGSSNLLLGVFLAICTFAAFFYAFAASSIGTWVLGVILLCFAALILLDAAQVAGKPVIILSESGFRTPHTPFVQWEKVDGIFLQQIMSRGRVSSNILMFRIPSLGSEIGRYSLLIRLLYPLRKGGGNERLGAMLKNTGESPTVIYRLARLLWTARTGLRHDWDPNMSDVFNAGLRQMSDTSAMLANKQAFGEMLVRDPVAVSTVVSSAMHGGQVMVSELRRNSRILSWISWFTIIVGALYLALLLARYFA